MTSIRFYRSQAGHLRGFSVIGHTGSAPAGEDIVCAGISALSITAANALESVAGVTPRTHVRDGFLSVRLPANMSAKTRFAAQVILRTARQGFSDMAVSYPQYVRVD